jgi:hypothetical protein
MPSTDRKLELKASHRWLSRVTDDCVGEMSGESKVRFMLQRAV